MLKGQLKDWKVAEKEITVTLSVENTADNRTALAGMVIKEIVDFDVSQMEFELAEDEDNDSDN